MFYHIAMFSVDVCEDKENRGVGQGLSPCIYEIGCSISGSGTVAKGNAR